MSPTDADRPLNADADTPRELENHPSREVGGGQSGLGPGLAAEASRPGTGVSASTPTKTDSSDSADNASLHWLYRPSSLPILWAIQILILVLAVLPDVFIHHHAHFPDSGFGLDASFGFFAWYGFATCAAMVVGAKILGIFLKRKDSYYDD